MFYTDVIIIVTFLIFVEGHLYATRLAMYNKSKREPTKVIIPYKGKLLNKTRKAKKKYYVQVRAYKTVNGKKVYSSWSSVKSAKTK